MVAYPSGFATLPKTYRFALADAPGAAAANAFLSVFNPASSVIAHRTVSLITSVYAAGISNTAGSLVLRRSSAHSGGTLITPGAVARFRTDDPDPVTQVRTGNPTVTAPGPALRGIPPSMTVGANIGGTGSDVSQALAATVAGWILQPGEGLVFATPAGNANQLWNIAYTWSEVPL